MSCLAGLTITDSSTIWPLGATYTFCSHVGSDSDIITEDSDRNTKRIVRTRGRFLRELIKSSLSGSQSESRKNRGSSRSSHCCCATMGFCNITATHSPNDSRYGVPTCDLFVDPSLPPSQMYPKVRDVCRALMHEWDKYSDDELDVSSVSGGITNLLLKVSIVNSNRPEDSVTVRIFGPNTDAVIDRRRELQAICVLSNAGFGARLHGVYQNGMVQSFIDAETLRPSDMNQPEMAALIAKELRCLHKVEIPGSKEPQLWKDLTNLYDKASSLSFEDHRKQKRYALISFEKLRQEIDVLKGISNSLKAPVVFAHNDLLSGNLMYSKNEEKLYLIDFEYSSYNFRGYDIGNHFAEYAGFECDYSLYPDKEAQYHFFRHYLNPDNPNKVTQGELEELYVETNFYCLASHLFWAIWAIVQAKFSPINFDYLEYFSLRFKEYENRRDDFISLAVKYLDKRKR